VVAGQFGQPAHATGVGDAVVTVAATMPIRSGNIRFISATAGELFESGTIACGR
jgi:hypothetical protein